MGGAQTEPSLIPYVAEGLPRGDRVLVLAPHPDDEAFGCGGCARLHVVRGDRVSVVVITDGAGAGDPEVRRAESEQACARLGTQPPEFWQLPDRGLAFQTGLLEHLMRLISEALERGGHALVYAPSPWEVHPDHRATAIATAAAVLERQSKGQMVQWCAYEVGAPLWPTRLVDIDAALEAKQAAMATYASQAPFQDYADHIGALNRYRTYTLGRHCRMAEALWEPSAPQLQAVLAAHLDGWRHPSSFFDEGRPGTMERRTWWQWLTGRRKPTR